MAEVKAIDPTERQLYMPHREFLREDQREAEEAVGEFLSDMINTLDVPLAMLPKCFTVELTGRTMSYNVQILGTYGLRLASLEQ
jgi:hypothetical protein